MVFNSLTSWTGSPGYTRSPSTVHRTRILSPNIASLAILTASVAVLDSRRSLEYFSAHDNITKVDLTFISNGLTRTFSLPITEFGFRKVY